MITLNVKTLIKAGLVVASVVLIGYVLYAQQSAYKKMTAYYMGTCNQKPKIVYVEVTPTPTPSLLKGHLVPTTKAPLHK